MPNKIPTNAVFDINAKPKGFTRIFLATKNTLRAFVWLFKNESAFKQECVALVIAIPLTFLFDITLGEQIILVATVLFVMLCEVLNTAIEVVVDRIGLELHPLSGLAKDLGSAAVSIGIILAGLTWVVILI